MTSLHKKIRLLLSADQVGSRIPDHDALDLEIDTYLNAAKFFVPHDGVVISSDQNIHAFASDTNQAVEGLVVKHRSCIEPLEIGEGLPEYLMFPDTSARGRQFKEFLDEITAISRHCCCTLIESFCDLESPLFKSIKGDVFLLEDHRLLASVNYQSAQEIDIMAMFSRLGVSSRNLVSADIAESLIPMARASYAF